MRLNATSDFIQIIEYPKVLPRTLVLFRSLKPMARGENHQQSALIP